MIKASTSHVIHFRNNITVIFLHLAKRAAHPLKRSRLSREICHQLRIFCEGRVWFRSYGAFTTNDDEIPARLVLSIGKRHEICTFPIDPHIARPPRNNMVQSKIHQRTDIDPLSKVRLVDSVEESCGCPAFYTARNDAIQRLFTVNTAHRAVERGPRGHIRVTPARDGETYWGPWMDGI